MDKKYNAITEGVIWKQLLIFFFPILLGTFFQQLYNTIDMLVVGRYVGKEALASVGGSSGQLVNLVVGFFTGLSAGAGVIISQHFGAGNSRMVSAAIHTAYAFSIAGSVLFGAFGIFIAPQLLRNMNTPEELLRDSSLYLQIYFGGILFVFIYNIGSGILRALGDSKRPLYYLIICCIVNIVMDVFNVVVLQMGVAGVAVATVFAQAVSAVLVTGALMRLDDSIRLRLRNIRFHKKVFVSQLRLGIPGGVQSVMYSLSNIIIQSSVNMFGTDAAAAWATVGKIDAIFWMISGAFGASITTFTGQNYGAGKIDRVDRGSRICLYMYQGTSIFVSALLMLGSRFLLGIFTTDPDVIRIGHTIMMMIIPFYVVFGFVEIFSSTLRGMGDVFIPMLLTLGGVCLLRIVWIFTAVPVHPGLMTVLFCYPVTWVVTGILFIFYFRYRKNKVWQTHGHLSGQGKGG